MTYGLFAYPSEWLATLERMHARRASMIVPGHGTPMTDGVRLRATMALLRREILAPATDAGGGTFALYLVEWIVPRIFQEIDGTLDNAIPRSP